MKLLLRFSFVRSFDRWFVRYFLPSFIHQHHRWSNIRGNIEVFNLFYLFANQTLESIKNINKIPKVCWSIIYSFCFFFVICPFFLCKAKKKDKWSFPSYFCMRRMKQKAETGKSKVNTVQSITVDKGVNHFLLKRPLLLDLILTLHFFFFNNNKLKKNYLELFKTIYFRSLMYSWRNKYCHYKKTIW